MMRAADAVILGAEVDSLVTARNLARARRRVVVLWPAGDGVPRFALSQLAAGYSCPALHHGGSAPLIALAGAGARPLTIAADQIDPVLATLHRQVRVIARALGKFMERPAPSFASTPLSSAGMSLGARAAIAWWKLGREERIETMRVVPMSAADWLRERIDAKSTDAERWIAALAGGMALGTSHGPRAPGTAGVLLHQLLLNGWPRGNTYPPGGLAPHGAALWRAARDAGVEFIHDDPAVRIVIDARGVTGVVTRSGINIETRVVASALGLRESFQLIDDPGALPMDLRMDLRAHRARGASAKVNLALAGLPRLGDAPSGFVGERALSGLIHIGDSIDDHERAADAARRGELPARPLLELAFPSLRDPTLAPPVGAVASIFFHHVPASREGESASGAVDTDSASMRERILEITLARLEEVFPGIRALVVASEVLTPADIEARFALPGGHLFAGELALDQLFSLRPAPSVAAPATPIAGLYLSGPACHPADATGGSAGLLAANAIIKGIRV